MIVSVLGSACASTEVYEFRNSPVPISDAPIGAIAIIQARAYKTHDTTPELLRKAATAAKEIGAEEIACNLALPQRGAANKSAGIVEATTAVNEAKGLTEAVTGLIKSVIALPMTVSSEAISDKTLICTAFEKAQPVAP